MRSAPGRRSTPRSTTTAPRLDPPHPGTLAPGDPDDLRARADLEGVHYESVTADELDLSSARIDGAEFQDLLAREARLKGATFTDVLIRHLDVPVVAAMRTQWRDVQLTGRLGSVEAYEVEWRSVHFTGCKIGYLNLRGAELLDVVFTDCQIDDLDLVGGTARRVALRETRVGQLNVQGSTLHDVDLRGADLETVAGVRHLAGATISSYQLALFAPLFAADLEIQVED